jgi:hypothetical protein
VDKHAVRRDTVELGLNEQAVEMLQHAVHAAVGDDAHQVKLGRGVGFDAGNHPVPRGVVRELFVGEKFVQAHEFLVHDAARADVFVTDFRVAHLAGGQTHIETAGRHLRARC